MADIHNRFNRFRAEFLPYADYVVVAGDITNAGRSVRIDPDAYDNLQRARAWLDSLRSQYGGSRVIVIPGNHDIGCHSSEFGEGFCEPSTVHTLAPALGDAALVVCWTESLCTAFDAPELSLSWAHTTSDPGVDLARWALCPEVDVIISHCPPHGARDLAISGARIGSPGLAEAIRRVRPKLVVCGHVHEDSGIKVLAHEGGNTLVVNCAKSVGVAEVTEAGASWSPAAWKRSA